MAVLTVSSSQCLTTILAFALAFAFHTCSPLGLAEATSSGGFSLELIHRDSPQSPLYNASETSSQRMANSLLRSLRRAERFGANPYNSFEYDIPGETGYYQSGEFLMKVGFGTPPVPTYLIVDTTSNLVWTQCKGCTNCIPWDITAYDPSASSTYGNVACFSHSCQSLQNNCTQNTCRYTLYYDDGSTYTMGVLGTEYLTVSSSEGKLITLPNFRFGCGYDNEMFFSGKVTGVLGMGSGFISLAYQLQYYTGPKFSYCFIPSYDVPGRLTFGDSSLIPGPNVVSTPLILDGSDSLYRFTLTAVSIGTTRVELGKFAKIGNMVVDSSTAWTLLPTPTYVRLANEVRKIINATELEPPFGESFEHICYPSRVPLPHTRLAMHLDGADLAWKLSDMFMKDSAGVACLTIAPTHNQNLFFLGNWAQSNFRVGFDVNAKTLSFKPSDCTGL